MKRITYSFLLAVTIFLPSITFAFNDTITHPKLSEASVEQSLTVSNQYLEQNLRIKNGIDSSLNGISISKRIQDGAELEDVPMCRASNHFHNPYLDWTASGLSDTWFLTDWWCWATSPYKPSEIKSNVIWATGYADRGYVDPYFDVSTINGWNWESARLAYLSYLTGRDGENNWQLVQDEQRRNFFLSYTFEALGHTMHLLQDMAVPAHVRDDFSQGHTRYLYNHEPTLNISKWFGNLFEDYVRHNNRSSWFENNIDGDFSDFRITDLWDTNVLRSDTTPEQLNQISMSSLGMAEYTSMNFLSRFSMFEKDASDDSLIFAYPKPEHCVVQIQQIEIQDEIFERPFLTSGNGHPGEVVNKLAAVGYLKHYRDVYFPNVSNEMLPIALDNNCYEEYAQKLIPRAIGYSAALLDYFFRGQLTVSAIPRFENNTLKYITLNIANVTETQEAMTDGHFFLLFKYTPKDGNPDGSDDVFVLGAQTPPVSALACNESVEFHIEPSEPIPMECWDSVQCTLAFYGTLGNEPDAVVGKVFEPGTITILFNEEWNNGINGTNNWQNAGNDDAWSTKQVVDGHLIMESTTYPDYVPSGRWNTLIVDLKADGGQGIPITPTTYLQFRIPQMSSTVGNPIGANHALALYFSDGAIIEYSGDGRLCDWTDPDLLIPLTFDLDKIITDNIRERYTLANRPIPDPLYLEAIQLMQAAIFETMNDYYFYMDVDAVQLFDTQREE